MEMLQLNDLHKTFNPGTVNEKVALNGVSLHMEAGDFATIVGSNGAGKSTLFGAIAGIIFVLPRSVQPDSLGRTVTFYVWTILLLGGAATILGPVLGSCVLWVLLTFVKEVMRNTVPETLISSNQIEALGWVIVGVALMCLVIFRPQGLLGDRKELAFHA